MRMSLVPLALLVLLVSSCGPSVQRIVFGTDATWPPNESYDQKKELVGFEISVVKEIAKSEGFEASFKTVVWDDLYSGLEKGSYQAVVSAISDRSEKKDFVEFSKPYGSGSFVIAVKKGNDTLLKQLDRAIDKLNASGAIRELESRAATAAP